MGCFKIPLARPESTLLPALYVAKQNKESKMKHQIHPTRALYSLSISFFSLFARDVCSLPSDQRNYKLTKLFEINAELYLFLSEEINSTIE